MVIPVQYRYISFWVTLSEMTWQWYDTAEFKNNKWGLTDGDHTGGGHETATSRLPEWNDNLQKHDWIDI